MVLEPLLQVGDRAIDDGEPGFNLNYTSEGIGLYVGVSIPAYGRNYPAGQVPDYETKV